MSGASASSRRAQENLARLKAESLPTTFQVEIIDVLKEPGRAEKAGILATPTLSYGDQSRPRRIVGDLGDTARVLEFLGIDPRVKES